MNTFTTTIGQPNATSILFFFFFICATLVITYYAARKSRSASQFYAAGRSVTGWQNGLALAGDYMSAASFLGIAGLVSLKGYDGLIYSIGFLVGWPIIMFLIAEPLRNLGKYTFADVVAYRLSQKPIRVAASIGSLLDGVLLSYRPDGGFRRSDHDDVRPALRNSHHCRGRGHDRLCALWRHAGHHLGADHQSRPACWPGPRSWLIMALSHFDYDVTVLFSTAAAAYGEKVLNPGGLDGQSL